LSNYVVLDTDVASLSFRYDVAVAQAWGQLAASGQRRGRPAPVNDTWIAACCLAEGLPLATFNIKDHLDFARHHGLTLIGAA
jgi:predicted nucleic acid-binding protein